MKSDGSLVEVVDETGMETRLRAAMTTAGMEAGRVMTRAQAERDGLVMLSEQELVRLGKMTPLERALFAKTKMRELGRRRSLKNASVRADLVTQHPLGNLDREERRRERNRLKARRRK